MIGMSNFIYVSGEDNRDRLILMGYSLLKQDTENHIYVFLNQGIQDFACSDIKFAMSDTLTF